MAIFKCKMCGGSLEVSEEITVCECGFCGTQQTLPKVGDEVIVSLFNRANNLRMKCEFDKAQEIYEKIISSVPTDAEAYWGLILCKYGIEYVEDPSTFKKIPTCHRTHLEAVQIDLDYLSAIKNADSVQREIYKKEAQQIDKLQKDILEIVHKEKLFDVFICYKESDENGKRTPDSVIANDIYHQLTQEGIKVFYAAITLENKLGQAYEPYIFAALNSAKIMLVIGTKPEYFTAVWVKNEWLRYLKLMKSDHSRLLIPCYKNMDAYELPEEFSHLQAQDMSKIGFINDVIRAIKKLLIKEEISHLDTAVKNNMKIIASSNINAENILKRGMLCLEDGKWSEAESFFEQVLNVNVEEPRAYLGKLMVEYRLQSKDYFLKCNTDFGKSDNYRNAIRFGNEQFQRELKEYRNKSIYNTAVETMNNAVDDVQFITAKNMFLQLGEYSDSSEKAEFCQIQSLEYIYKTADDIMRHAERLIESKKYEAYSEASKYFKKLEDYKDSARMAEICTELAVTAEKENKYQSALRLCDRNNIDDITSAMIAFQQLNGYNDSYQQEEKCKQLIQELNYKIQLEAKQYAEKCELNKKRMKSAKKLLAVNYATTAMLKTNGTVIVIGDNSYGQCNTTEWRGIVNIDCYSQLTCALDYNSVIRTSERKKWVLEGNHPQKIVSVVIGLDDVIGLKADGTVTATKAHNCATLSKWRDIIAISASAHHIVGLKSDGTVVAVGDNKFGECNVFYWNNIYDIHAGYETTFGIRKDGKVEIVGRYNDTFKKMKTWDNIAMISSDMRLVVALKSDGTVVNNGGLFDVNCMLSEIEKWENIIAIGVSNDHIVGLKSNGSLVAAGDNVKGQCNVEGIKLFQDVDKIDEELHRACEREYTRLLRWY